MVETITPVVNGGSRRRWVAAVTAHTLGAGLSAAAFGAALGAVGMVFGGPWPVGGTAAVAVVAGLYAGRELLGLPVPVPERRRQVPEHWRWTFGPFVASFLYGLGLGIGFLTHVRYGTLVLVSAAAVAVADPALGGALLVGFGLSRGLSLGVTARATTSERLLATVDRLDRLARSRVPKMANGTVLAAVAAATGLAAVERATGDPSQALAAVLAAVFAWAAAAKLLDRRGWRETLAAHRLGALERPVSRAVPAAEAAVAGLVLWGASAGAAALAMTLLAAFSAAILRARALHGDRLPCGCFGRARARDYRVLLARNASLAALAVVVLATGARFPLLQWARLPRPAEVVPAALVAVGVIAVCWLARRALTTLRGQPG